MPSATASARAARGAEPLPFHGNAEAAGIPFHVHVTAAAEPDASLPLVVAIHGLGSTPASFRLFADCPTRLRVVRPQAPKSFRDGFSWFDLDAREGADLAATALRREAKRLVAFMGELTRRYPTDGKPLVTGFSQGGMLSFAIAVLHPESIRAAYPLAGWLPEELRPDEAPAHPVPIYAQHGADDRILPLIPTMTTVDALKKAGIPVELEVHPSTRHTVSLDMRQRLHAQVASTLR